MASATSASKVKTAGSCTRVMLVDDSIVVRSIIERILDSDEGLEVVASVATAPEALDYLGQAPVDTIILDLEMPVMHGHDAIPLLMAKAPGVKIIILSANCEDGGPAAVQALALGAADTLLKPGRGSFAGRFGATLIERVHALADHVAEPDSGRPHLQAGAPLQPQPVIGSRSIEAIAIGASTGGIMAINSFLAALPADVSAPLFITQHLPAGFIRYFAEQLQRSCLRQVTVAADGMAVRLGHVYLAPGEAHMRVMPLSGGYRIVLDRTPAPSGACPSVDPMMASLAESYGPHLCGVMLSGMGRDGLAGAQKIKRNGGLMLAQDVASSVVWGMPGAVAREGLAEAQGNPEQLAKILAGIALGGGRA